MSDKYSITFISKLEGATEQRLIVAEYALNNQLRILIDSDYKILKVKLIEAQKL